MPLNRLTPDRWMVDIATSVDTYNTWFMKFAPKTYRDERVKATEEVTAALSLTNNLRDISPEVLKQEVIVSTVVIGGRRGAGAQIWQRFVSYITISVSCYKTIF